MEVIVPARNGIDRESFHFKGSMQTLYECIEWTQRDGIVGRGILLDHFSWAESRDIKYSPIEHHAITVQDPEAVAAAQGTELRPGGSVWIREMV
jgi:hypothetical protein